jgi:hypothetical protein
MQRVVEPKFSDEMFLTELACELELSNEMFLTELELSNERALIEIKLSTERALATSDFQFLHLKINLEFQIIALGALVLARLPPDSPIGKFVSSIISDIHA